MIAATNLESVLDEAVYRRFDEVVWFDLPTKAQITQYVKRKFRNVQASFDPTTLLDTMADYSLAEIERACVQAIKAPIIARREKVDETDLRAAIKDMNRRRKGMARLKSK